MKNILIIAFIAFCLSSCLFSCRSTKNNTNDDANAAPRFSSLPINVGNLIRSDAPFAAYMTILKQESNTNNIANVDFEEQKQRVFDHVRQMYETAESENDFFIAEYIVSSLKRMDILDVITPQKTLNEILLNNIEKDYDEKNYFTAMKNFIHYMQTASPSNDLLIKYADLAVEINNNFYLYMIIEEFNKRGINVDQKYIDAVQKVDSHQDMIKGTVTVWVNRGIRVRQGMGMPDRGIGSGFFIDPRGYFITNYHVIESEVNPEYEGFSRLYIRLSDAIGTRIPAKVIGWDPVFDIALLKTEYIPEYMFSPSESTRFQIGDRIYAIGSPGGLQNTLTSGIISSRSRRFLQMGDAIQVDVPINPGNSGGPLLNTSGELVGVVFAGIAQFEGVNFAIPSHWVTDIVSALYNGGEVIHSMIGSIMYERRGSIEVVYNVPGEAAEVAGLRKCDIIQSINGKRITTVIEAQKILMSLRYDAVVDIEYHRDGKTENVLLALSSRRQRAFDTAMRRDSMRNLVLPLFGMEIEPFGNYLFTERFVVKNIYEGSVADEIGLSVDDPLVVRGWRFSLRERYAILRIEVKRRKAGFMQNTINLIARIDSSNLL